jgi:hypothetical protein
MSWSEAGRSQPQDQTREEITMKKKEALHGRRSVLKTLLLYTLVIALSMIVVPAKMQVTVQAQSNCVLNCQQEYSACINREPGPGMQIACETAYDNCVEACI